MIVVVERPETTIFGGAVAAPIFQQVMSYALHHYNIPSNAPISVPSRRGCLDLLGRDLMQLGDILDDLALDVATGCLEISHVDIDSRECVPGSLFFALPGGATNGSLFAHDAVDRGAVCVVSSEELSVEAPVIVVRLANFEPCAHTRVRGRRAPRDQDATRRGDGNERQDQRHHHRRYLGAGAVVERREHRHAHERAYDARVA